MGKYSCPWAGPPKTLAHATRRGAPYPQLLRLGLLRLRPSRGLCRLRRRVVLVRGGVGVAALLLLFRQGADPDVAVADGVAVVLEADAALLGVLLVGRLGVVAARADQLGMVLRQHAVVQHRHRRRALQLARRIEPRPAEDDVVRLP